MYEVHIKKFNVAKDQDIKLRLVLIDYLAGPRGAEGLPSDPEERAALFACCVSLRDTYLDPRPLASYLYRLDIPAF